MPKPADFSLQMGAEKKKKRAKTANFHEKSSQKKADLRLPNLGKKFEKSARMADFALRTRLKLSTL